MMKVPIPAPPAPKRGRPRASAETEAEIRRRLLRDETPSQIRREVAGQDGGNVGFAVISRVKAAVERERTQERQALLGTIANYVLKGSSLNVTEVQDLIFRATGVRLRTRGQKKA